MIELRRIVAASALVLMLGGMTGCGSMTTAPVVTAGSSIAAPAPVPSNSVVAVEPIDAVAGTAPAPTAATVGVLGGVLQSILGLIVRTIQLIGSVGGSVTNGRWRVDVPANAIQGSASMGIGVAAGTSPACQLEIVPATKNHFSVPVILTVDCRTVPGTQLAHYVIFWFDPATSTWVPVAGSHVDPVHKTVSAPLQHFSRYAVGPADGKAGW